MRAKKTTPANSLHPFFFWLMNSSPSSLMGYYTLAIEFLVLKYYQLLIILILSLSSSGFLFSSDSLRCFFFFLSFYHSLRCRCFFFPHKPNEIKKKKRKKKEKRKKIDLFISKRINPNTKHKTKYKIQFLK